MRRNLPAWQQRNNILTAVNRHQVIVISGMTGQVDLCYGHNNFPTPPPPPAVVSYQPGWSTLPRPRTAIPHPFDYSVLSLWLEYTIALAGVYYSPGWSILFPWLEDTIPLAGGYYPSGWSILFLWLEYTIPLAGVPPVMDF